MLSFFQRLTHSDLVPHHGARRALQREIARGRAAENELRGSYASLERQIAAHADELAGASERLRGEMERCKRAESRFSAISEAVPYGAWIYRLDGTAEMVSASYLQMLGQCLEGVQKLPWFSFVHPEDRERVSTLWYEVTAAGIAWNCEFRIVGCDGQARHILSRGAPLADSEKPFEFFAGVQLDISERAEMRDDLMRSKERLELLISEKTLELRDANRQLLRDLAERTKAEAALRDSESELRAIYENALDSMIVLDDQRRILDVNESAEQLFGMSEEQMKALRWDDLVPPERLVGLEERWTEFLQGGTKRGEVEVRRADGSVRVVAFSSRASIVPGKHLITVRDITDHREAEDSLRLLSHRLIRLQDDERRRIARELHDSTGQGLAALQMHLEAIRVAAPGLPAKARKALDEANTTCNTCTTEIRTISYLLHPPLLDEVGLMPALEWYVSGFSERCGIQVTREVTLTETQLSTDLNTALFRIIQEALTNIHKHSESKRATIRLGTNNGYLVLEISDDGKGLDPSRVLGRRRGVQGLGVGITGMRERVRQLGGTLEITAGNPGTLVKATFPLKDKEEEHGNL